MCNDDKWWVKNTKETVSKIVGVSVFFAVYLGGKKRTRKYRKNQTRKAKSWYGKINLINEEIKIKINVKLNDRSFRIT